MSQTVSRLEKITPARAQQLLGLVKNNRSISGSRVSQWAESMKRGEWFPEVSAIWLNGDGNELLDGQHRLRAVVESEVTVMMRVNRGAPPQLKYAIDTGRGRVFGEVLQMEGYKRAALLAATTRWEYNYRQNPAMSRRGGLYVIPTHLQLLDLLRATPTLEASAELISGMVKKFAGWLPTSQAAFLHHRFLQASDESFANWFWGRMADGTEVSPDHPITRVRQYIMEKRRTKQVILTPRFQLAIIIKAWNLIAQGEESISKAPYWRPATETFPNIFSYEEEA